MNRLGSIEGSSDLLMTEDWKASSRPRSKRVGLGILEKTNYNVNNFYNFQLLKVVLGDE